MSAGIIARRIAHLDLDRDRTAAPNAQGAADTSRLARCRRCDLDVDRRDQIAGSNEDAAAAQAIDNVGRIALARQHISLGIFAGPEIIAALAPVPVGIGGGGDPPTTAFAQQRVPQSAQPGSHRIEPTHGCHLAIAAAPASGIDRTVGQQRPGLMTGSTFHAHGHFGGGIVPASEFRRIIAAIFAVGSGRAGRVISDQQGRARLGAHHLQGRDHPVRMIAGGIRRPAFALRPAGFKFAQLAALCRRTGDDQAAVIAAGSIELHPEKQHEIRHGGAGLQQRRIGDIVIDPRMPRPAVIGGNHPRQAEAARHFRIPADRIAAILAEQRRGQRGRISRIGLVIGAEFAVDVMIAGQPLPRAANRLAAA